jgi:hypothetical protein
MRIWIRIHKPEKNSRKINIHVSEEYSNITLTGHSFLKNILAILRMEAEKAGHVSKRNLWKWRAIKTGRDGTELA